MAPPLKWIEPPFFRLRTAGFMSWIVRLGIVAFLTQVFVNSGPGNTLVTSLAFAVGFVFMYDATTMQRTIVITDHGIECLGIFASVGHPIWSIIGSATWNRHEIGSVMILRPGEAGNRFSYSVMQVCLKHAQPRLLGIKPGKPVDQIAERIRAMNVPVELSAEVVDLAEVDLEPR